MSALASLLEQHRERLLNMLRWRMPAALAGRVDAEDLLGNVFLAARRKWAAFQREPGLSPWAWLYRLALDALSEAWSRETRGIRDVKQELPFPERSSAQIGLGLIAPAASPSSAAGQKELEEKLREALDQLRPADREILVMRHYDQLSFKEAAEVLGITQNAANVRYVRALDRLKDRLKQLDFD